MILQKLDCIYLLINVSSPLNVVQAVHIRNSKANTLINMSSFRPHKKADIGAMLQCNAMSEGT